MSKSRSNYCSVFGCLNSSANTGLSFFTIPTEQERRLQWLRLIGREDLTETSKPRVCEIHFNVQDINVKATRKTLKKNSLPCLRLPNETVTKEDKYTQVIEKITANASSQTEISNILLNGTKVDSTTASFSSQRAFMTSESITQASTPFSADTPRKRKLKSDLLGCKKRLKVYATEQNSKKSQQNTFYKLCDRFLSKELAELVRVQQFLKSSLKEKRYTMAYKMYCLNLYHVSPQAYQILEKSICLPSKTTLNKLNIPINDELMTVLKLKMNNMSERAKHCTMVVGVMSLKTKLYYDIKNDKIIGFHEVDGVQSPLPAKYAVVVLIRGIFANWSQAIGIAFISESKYDDDISKWIDKIIIKLLEIGLKVRVFVSDSLNAAKKRGISVEKTYFTINDYKIYYIFDAPHLIKLIRNNFLTSDFHFQNGAIAKFEHIVKFYECDSKRNYKQAHKLTNSHINPTSFEKINVRYATQLLSRSVASGLSTYIDFKVIDESARHTAEFVKTVNDLFDTLNSSTVRHCYSHKKAFCGDTNQVDFFNNMLIFFEKLKLINPRNGNDVTETIQFIQGFRITIQSILHLFENLKQEGFQNLLTRRLNMDIIEKVFENIRSKNDMIVEPTSRQFISAFRKIYLDNITHVPKESKCREGLTEILVRLNDYYSRDNECKEIDVHPAIDNTQENSLHEIVRCDYTQFDIPEKNALAYVCGVLLKECIDHHEDCELLKCYLDADKPACNLSAENFAPDRNLLVVPPNEFVMNIERMEQVFHKAFENKYINSTIGMSIYEELTELDLTWPCPCFPKNYLLKLFIRMRIFFTLTSNNKAFKTCRNRRKYFSVTNL